MKEKLFIIYVMVFFGFSSAMAQCFPIDLENIQNNCIGTLKSNFTFTKYFDIEPNKFKYKGDKLEYKQVFSKGYTYCFSLCDKSNDDRVVIELYDRHKKLLATNYQKQKDKYYSKIFFHCRSTGVYYIKYYFRGRPTCGVSVLGMHPQHIKKK